MAGDRSLAEILTHIEARQSFVVEAGAGSGKTSSLVGAVRSILDQQGVDLERSGRKVACITFTNVAKNEISDRLNQDGRVEVDTIHEFLWRTIASFQKELRVAVLDINRGLKTPVEELDDHIGQLRITYGQYGRRFEKGELQHDDVLAVARSLFESYPKITRIAADRFPYILVDEYQDTDVRVVELLLEYFVKNPRRPVVGLFGDTMQQIYDSKVEDVANRYGLKVVTKLENYRCSIAVINTINRLRTDIQQVPGGNNRVGSTHLLAASEPTNALQLAREHLAVHGWTDENTKTLILTHKGIAREAGFAELARAYSLRSFGNDALTERSDEFGELFTYVESLREAHRSRRYGSLLELLGKNGFRVEFAGSKQLIANEVELIETLANEGTVRQVVDFTRQSQVITTPRKLSQLIDSIDSEPSEDAESFAKRRESYEAILTVPWTEVASFVRYADQRTPFSTQHGVKGAEFENVLVVVDDSLWSMYKFAHVFTNDGSNAARLERSRRLLYVSFSRAMDGLAVLSVEPLRGATREQAAILLGVEDAVDIG